MPDFLFDFINKISIVIIKYADITKTTIVVHKNHIFFSLKKKIKRFKIIIALK